MWRLRPRHPGELHLCSQLAVASRMLRLQGETFGSIRNAFRAPSSARRHEFRPPPFLFFFSGVLHAIHKRQLLWSRRPALLRVSLPRAPRLPVLRLPEAHHWPLHHSHGQEVPPRTLCVCFLPQAAEQRHLQGAEWKALLPELLC